MPRTKVVKKEPKSLPRENEYDIAYKKIYQECKDKLISHKERLLEQHRLISKQKRLAIPRRILNTKMEDLRQNVNWNTLSTMIHSSVLTNDKTKKKTSDDGYQTSDSTTETSGGLSRTRSTRRSQSTTRAQSLRRSSRSLSRQRQQAPVAASTVKKERRSRSVSRSTTTKDRFKTPANNRKLENFGMVTPKMKPNTPSVLLRRPGQGEIAISLRGSPLMTTAVVSETTANVNIPLSDGRMYNIQPMKGLRASEIPELDPEMQRQLKTLRDNLDQVCQLARIK